MATSKKFSQLPAASSITNNDLAAIAHEDALAETGYESQKATMIQIGKKLLGDIEYVTDLPGFPSDEQNPFAALVYLRDSILDLLPVDEVSGAVANFDTDVVLPLIDVKAEIKAVETGTGAKSPSNPYVISGFTGANISHSDADTSNPTVYTFSWQTEVGEVFGGYFQISENGTKLVATHKEIILDDENITWDYRSTQKLFRSSAIDNLKIVTRTADVPNWLCEIFNVDSSTHVYNDSETYDNSIACISTAPRLYISYQTAQGDLTAFKNAIAGKKLFYELETPVEYVLTPQQLFSALLGVNNVWNDTNGDTTVKYKLAIQAYIDKKIAEVQALVL